MVKLTDFESRKDTTPEPEPGSAKYIGLKLIKIAEDLTTRGDSNPQAALHSAATGLRALGFDEFAVAARRLGQLADEDMATGAQELASAATHLTMEFTLAIHSAQTSGGSAQVDPSIEAHRPHGARFL